MAQTLSFGFVPKLSFHIPAAATRLRTATSPDQRTRAIAWCDQAEARRCWFMKLFGSVAGNEWNEQS